MSKVPSPELSHVKGLDSQGYSSNSDCLILPWAIFFLESYLANYFLLVKTDLPQELDIY